MIHRKNKKNPLLLHLVCLFPPLGAIGNICVVVSRGGGKGGGEGIAAWLLPLRLLGLFYCLRCLPIFFFVSGSFRVLAFFCGLFVGGFSSPLRSIKVFHCPRKRRGGRRRRKRYCFLPHFPSGWPLYHRKKGSSFAKSAAEKKSSNGELLVEIRNSEFDNLRHSHLPRHGKSLFTRLTWGISANKNRKQKN